MGLCPIPLLMYSFDGLNQLRFLLHRAGHRFDLLHDRLRMDGTPIGWAANRLLFGIKPDPEAVLAEYRAVTAADVQAVAHNLLQPGALAMAVVAPNNARHSAEEWAETLAY